MRRPHWLAGSLLLLACSSPHDNVIFTPTDTPQGGSVGVGGASGVGGSESAQAHSGTDSGSGSSGSTAGSGSSGAGPLAGSGGTVAAGGSSGSGGSGGSAGADGPPTPLVESCDMVPGSVVADFNGHCYRVNEAKLSFTAASAACKAGGGHLITIASDAENDFTRDLHDGEHWLGATDERADDVPGVGTYVWVTGEPWVFSDWEDGQPNAFETDCPTGGGDSKCYEHCAYQSDEGDWVDRSCWHTIVSICEWDVESRVDETDGLAGAAGGPT